MAEEGLLDPPKTIEELSLLVSTLSLCCTVMGLAGSGG